MSHVSKVSKLLRYSLAFSALSGTAFAAGCSGAPQGEEGTPDDTTPIAEVASPLVASPDLVISQLYGGGGNTNAVYKNDFVEIFNRSAAAVSLQGKSIQYASGTSNFTAASNVLALPNASIPAGGYFLVQLASGGAAGAALPTADFVATGTGALNFAKDKGKVALVDSAALLDGCGATATPCTAGNWIDLIGYGGTTATTSQFEGSAPAGLTANTTGVQRLGAGCQDTGDNGFDTQVQTPAARNSATTAVDCSGFDAGPPPPVDAGTDTGTVTDASTPDTGTVTDASSGTDASTVTDAGTKTDSGTKPKDGGTTTSDDSGTGSTSGGSDAGSTKKDAGKATSAASSDAPTASSDSGGCSVSTSTHSDSGLGLGAIGLALAAITRRRRKH